LGHFHRRSRRFQRSRPDGRPWPWRWCCKGFPQSENAVLVGVAKRRSILNDAAPARKSEVSSNLPSGIEDPSNPLSLSDAEWREDARRRWRTVLRARSPGRSVPIEPKVPSRSALSSSSTLGPGKRAAKLRGYPRLHLSGAKGERRMAKRHLRHAAGPRTDQVKRTAAKIPF